MFDGAQLISIPIWLIVVVILVVGGAIILPLFLGNRDSDEEDEEKSLYQYGPKKFFMTRAEHEFYDVLGQAVSADFRIFAQVHLPTIIEHKIAGQNWKAAFKNINGKSVDFVLCDKEHVSPVLAIELDDKTHDRPDRMERDVEVEMMLKQAGVPLLRIENNGGFSPSTVAAKVRAVLGRS